MFLHIGCVVLAQEKYKTDSLQMLAGTLPNGSDKVIVLLQLVNEYQDNNLEKAFEFGKEANTIALQLNDKRITCKVLNGMGNLYLLKQDLGAASKQYYTSLKIGEELKDDTVIAKCYNSIGKIYYFKNSYEEALDYFLKSLAINLRLNLGEEVSTNYIHIGSVYNNQKKYTEALQSFDNALKAQQEIGSKKNTAAVYSNMGISYFRMGKTDLAIESFKTSIQKAEVVGNKKYLATATANLASMYAMLNMLPEAAKALAQSLEYAKATGIKELIYSKYKGLAEFYKEQKDFPRAYEYAHLALLIKDTLHIESNSRLENELTVKHESDQKELVISSLKKDAEIAEAQLEQERNFKLFLAFIGIVVAISSFMLFRRIIEKRKTNKILSAAHDQIEKKNQSIIDSINYSKRIQDSILPSKQLKNKLFHEIFVLYMPKDIVSGDFYWYAEKNGKKIVACCDCTGHGVPGALMSMIGNNILNQVVNENEIISPDEILNHLNLEIRKALKQDTQNKSMDGMDLALIAFNGETEIEYAGAHRPLWIVRKVSSASACELIEIKANKVSIGGYQDENGKTFVKHTVQLLKGDCIYMFTDGYADQFGGKEGKKFMTKRLKELLISNYSNSIAEQEQSLTESIIAWKGLEEQVDDICVIGIRI